MGKTAKVALTANDELSAAHSHMDNACMCYDDHGVFTDDQIAALNRMMIQIDLAMSAVYRAAKATPKG